MTKHGQQGFRRRCESSPRLITCHLSLVTCHLSLVTHHSPLTTHHSLFTTRYSPLTTHHSPFATHRSRKALIMTDEPDKVAAMALGYFKQQGIEESRTAKVVP